jgi:DNA-binding HxlR family transcriptional regulator
MPRRSYDQYCALSRALDVIGERWTLLIVRELLAGPRRYTDLHADLPGVSTDVLASRLRELVQDGLVTRERLPRPTTTSVYELTDRGRELLPALSALAGWGASLLTEPNRTDAVRAHWFALPLLDVLLPAVAAAGLAGTADLVLDEVVCRLRLDPADPGYADGPARQSERQPDARLHLDLATCRELAERRVTPAAAVEAGALRVDGDTPLAKALRGAGC